MTAIRYKTKLGKRGDGGDWNPDTATEHAIDPYDSGRTLCGRPIGTKIDNGGPWELSSWNHVSCAQCLKRAKAGIR
jgi:hypothetical protein